MKRKLVIDSSDHGRKEISYDSLSLHEIESRIRAYEKKHGVSFSRWVRDFNCDNASPEEMTDYMDWNILLKERAERRRLVTKQR